tara:strand:+ start:239 stop:901 length:663 start_codon:yes stop_codon:yes gene_type:complete
MRKREYKSDDMRKYMDSPEEQLQAAERFRLFCEKATAKNKNHDDFGPRDTYKLVRLLEPDFTEAKQKSAEGNYRKLSRDHSHYLALSALKKLFIASLHFETPEIDEGGMPTSGYSFRTRYLNAHLDKKINELKELEESTTQDGIGKKLEDSLTVNAKLRINNVEKDEEIKELDDECKRLARLLEDKDTMMASMVKKSHWKMMEAENKELNKLLNKLGNKQ